MAEEPQNIDDNGTGDDPSWLKDLRKKADRLSQVEAQLQQFQDQESIRQAGLNLTPTQMTALLATHEGDKTADGLKSTAAELGFYTPEPEVAPEVQAGHEAVAAAANGAQSVPVPDAQDEYASANTPEEVMAIAERRGTAMRWD